MRCPFIYRYKTKGFLRVYGIQCKYDSGHDNSHCGYTLTDGDIFWTDGAAFLSEFSLPEKKFMRDKICTCTEPDDPRA